MLKQNSGKVTRKYQTSDSDLPPRLPRRQDVLNQRIHLRFAVLPVGMLAQPAHRFAYALRKGVRQRNSGTKRLIFELSNTPGWALSPLSVPVICGATWQMKSVGTFTICGDCTPSAAAISA